MRFCSGREGRTPKRACERQRVNLGRVPVVRSKAIPGRRAHGSDEGLQYSPNEGERIPMGDEEVDERQDATGMKEQTHDDGQGVHAQLTPKDGHVFHL